MLTIYGYLILFRHLIFYFFIMLFYGLFFLIYDYKMNDTIETNIVLLLRQIVRAIELDSKKLSTQFNTTPAQLLALRGLLKADSRTLAGLAEEVGLSSSTMVGVVDRLEKKGLLVRNRAVIDRRAVNIIITDAGKNYLKNSPKLLQDRLVSRLSTIDDSQKTVILESLEKVSMILDAEDIDASPVLDSGGLV